MILYYIYLYYYVSTDGVGKRISLYSKPIERKRGEKGGNTYIFISFYRCYHPIFLDIMNIQHFQQRWVCKAYKVNSGYTMHNLNATFTPARKTSDRTEKKKKKI